MNTNGWTLDRTGGPVADIVCPHGHPVDLINHYDYALNPNEQTYQITNDDLAAWLNDNAEWIGEYCIAH